MDKIIVNDVDVSGCKHYKDETCLDNYLLTDMTFSRAKCALNPNCYYKQLERKKQYCIKLNEHYTTQLESVLKELSEVKRENEKLKNDLDFYPFVKARKDEEKGARIQFEEEYEELKAENEELKKGNEIILIENADLKKHKRTCKKANLELFNSCQKYKQALDEIEKVIDSVGKGSVYANAQYGEILDIITKAKGK